MSFRAIPDIAQRVLLLGEDICVGGSWVVDPNKANDIDIVMPEWTHNYNDVHLTLHTMGFRQLQSGDEKYDEIDNMRLLYVYEYHPLDDIKTNVIVVGKYYWPAYYGAIARMQQSPELYGDRQARIDLHRGLCKQISEMLVTVLGY